MASERSKERAERAEKLRKQREAAERRRKLLISGGVIGGLVLVLIVGGVIVKYVLDARKIEVPKGVTAAGGVEIPTPEGVTALPTAPEVWVFEDFQCSACNAFEAAGYGTMIEQQAAAGEIKLTYLPVSFLDGNSANDYSSRAISASMCALDAGGPEGFINAHNILFDNYPAEFTAGPSSEQIYEELRAGTATTPGISNIDKDCVTSDKYARWGIQRFDRSDPTAQATISGVSGTPTVFVNGTMVPNDDAKTPQNEFIDGYISAVTKANGVAPSFIPTS